MERDKAARIIQKCWKNSIIFDKLHKIVKKPNTVKVNNQQRVQKKIQKDENIFARFAEKEKERLNRIEKEEREEVKEEDSVLEPERIWQQRRKAFTDIIPESKERETRPLTPFVSGTKKVSLLYFHFHKIIYK